MEEKNGYHGNKNYRKGRRKEYKICNQLKEAGFDITQRTAGSRSPFDVIAIHKKRKLILLIQCKPDDFAKTQELKILKENEDLNGMFKVRFIIQ